MPGSTQRPTNGLPYITAPLLKSDGTCELKVSDNPYAHLTQPEKDAEARRLLIELGVIKENE